MIPLLAQINLDINELVTVVGAGATMALLVGVTIFLVVRAVTNNHQADTEQQKSFTKMAMDNAGQIIKLHETIDGLNTKIIDMVEQRTTDREEIATLRTKYEHSQELHKIELGLLKDQLNRMEKQYSKMQVDLNVANADRDKYRLERDRLRDQMADLREQLVRLEAQNEAYKVQVQMAKTQPIPPLPEDEDAVDPNTPTPEEAQALLNELNVQDPQATNIIEVTATDDTVDNAINDDDENKDEAA